MKIKVPRWYRKNVTVALYKAKKSTPPIVWFVALVAACFAIPMAVDLKIHHPGIMSSIEFALKVSEQNVTNAFLVFAILALLAGFLMFLVNGAFVFVRVLAGYETRRKSSILKWFLYKVKKRLELRW